MLLLNVNKNGSDLIQVFNILNKTIMNTLRPLNQKINSHLIYSSFGVKKEINVLVFNEYGNVFFCDIDQSDLKRELQIERAICISQKMSN